MVSRPPRPLSKLKILKKENINCYPWIIKPNLHRRITTFHLPQNFKFEISPIRSSTATPPRDADFSGGGEQLPKPFPAGSTAAAAGRRQRPRRV